MPEIVDLPERFLTRHEEWHCEFRRFSYSGSGRFRTAIPEVFVQAW